MKSYLDFEDAPSATGKTVVTTVWSKRSDKLLGEIRWYGQWRQYCFYPGIATIFNRECLNHINAQIDRLMAERSRPVAKSL